MNQVAPKVFISYSHDNEQHKDWVYSLACRLRSNGVDVILDQWNLSLGGDLGRFMEGGLSSADRVLVVCSRKYIQKVNEGTGGANYEKMLLSGQMMQDGVSAKVIPVVVENDGDVLLPAFLSTKRYVDFRDKAAFESMYSQLVREIHGVSIKPCPPLGKNPFEIADLFVDPVITFSPERYVSPASSGIVSFDFSSNNGRYIFGSGDMAFETAWTQRGPNSIYAYSDAKSIRSVAPAVGARAIAEIHNADRFDASSRTRSPRVGEILIWKNTAGYYLATMIQSVQVREYGALTDDLRIEYQIAPLKQASFGGFHGG